VPLVTVRVDDHEAHRPLSIVLRATPHEEAPMTTGERILRVRITARDDEAIRALLRKRRLDVAGGVKRDENGVAGIDAYVPENELAQLADEPVDVEVVDDATATGRARQAEVGIGNRFAEPGVVPHGLGRKIGADDVVP
jgi:hypothetical protein